MNNGIQGSIGNAVGYATQGAQLNSPPQVVILQDVLSQLANITEQAYGIKSRQNALIERVLGPRPVNATTVGNDEKPYGIADDIKSRLSKLYGVIQDIENNAVTMEAIA